MLELFQWQVGAAAPNFEQPRKVQAGMKCMHVTWPKTDSSRNKDPEAKESVFTELVKKYCT
jgi:hypothetical protein